MLKNVLEKIQQKAAKKHYLYMYKGFIFHLLLDAYYFMIAKGMAQPSRYDRALNLRHNKFILHACHIRFYNANTV